SDADVANEIVENGVPDFFHAVERPRIHQFLDGYEIRYASHHSELTLQPLPARQRAVEGRAHQRHEGLSWREGLDGHVALPGGVMGRSEGIDRFERNWTGTTPVSVDRQDQFFGVGVHLDAVGDGVEKTAGNPGKELDARWTRIGANAVARLLEIE